MIGYLGAPPARRSMPFRSLALLVLAGLLALPAAAQEAATPERYTPGYMRGADIAEGTELVLVYLGQSTCAPCTWDSFKADLEAAKVALAARAEADSLAFAVIGVAAEGHVEEGLAFLRGSGAFDELVIGRSWFNSAVLSHLWRPDDLDERVVGFPSVIVFERDMTMAETIAASPPRYRVELAGADAVSEWVAAGAPLD